jgi:hypothetical protein
LHLLDALRYESVEQVTVADAMRRGVSTVAPDALSTKPSSA